MTPKLEEARVDFLELSEEAGTATDICLLEGHEEMRWVLFTALESGSCGSTQDLLHRIFSTSPSLSFTPPLWSFKSYCPFPVSGCY